jgi:hypothetical protein
MRHLRSPLMSRLAVAAMAGTAVVSLTALASGGSPAAAENGRQAQVRVDAPPANVKVDGERGKVRVDAPYANVRVDPDRGRVRVRAPYVDLNVRW